MRARSPRVVLVEDEEPVRLAVERALVREGIVVTGFDDYPGADTVLAAAPDLAVLDVLLPSGDGFELARALRAARDVPVVFLTARDASRRRPRQSTARPARQRPSRARPPRGSPQPCTDRSRRNHSLTR